MVRQPTTLTTGSTGTNDDPLAIRAMGIGYHGPISNWKMPSQILGSCNRLLHQMGGSRATGDHYRKEHSKLRMESSDLQVRNFASTRIEQRKAIQQSQVQAILPRVRHPQLLFISWSSTSQRTSWGYESIITQTHQNLTWGGKGVMARRTPKHTLGLQNNSQDTNGRNTISNDVWKRSNGARRNRTDDITNFGIRRPTKWKTTPPQPWLDWWS